MAPRDRERKLEERFPAGDARVRCARGVLLGRTVDLRTPGDLSPRFREEVLRAAATQYAA